MNVGVVRALAGNDGNDEEVRVLVASLISKRCGMKRCLIRGCIMGTVL